MNSDLLEVIEESETKIPTNVVREAHKAIEEIEDLERDISKHEDEVQKLEEEINELKAGAENLNELLRVRYPRLFFGDLGRLDDGERTDLFNAIAVFRTSDRRDSDSERMLHRLNGKL